MPETVRKAIVRDANDIFRKLRTATLRRHENRGNARAAILLFESVETFAAAFGIDLRAEVRSFRASRPDHVVNAQLNAEADETAFAALDNLAKA